MINSLDVDECTANTENCAQTCTNTDGSYTCSCIEGYTTPDDGIIWYDIQRTHSDYFLKL